MSQITPISGDSLLQGLYKAKDYLDQIDDLYYEYDVLETKKRFENVPNLLPSFEVTKKLKSWLNIPYILICLGACNILNVIYAAHYKKGDFLGNCLVGSIFSVIILAVGIYYLKHKEKLIKLAVNPESERKKGCLSKFSSVKGPIFPVMAFSILIYLFTYVTNISVIDPSSPIKYGFLGRGFYDLIELIAGPSQINLIVILWILHFVYIKKETSKVAATINEDRDKENQEIIASINEENKLIRRDNNNLTSQQNSLIGKIDELSTEFVEQVGSWYPLDYTAVADCEAFIKIVENHEADNVPDMMKIYKTDEHRKAQIAQQELVAEEMRRNNEEMQRSNKEMLRQQRMANAINTFNAGMNLIGASNSSRIARSAQQAAQNSASAAESARDAASSASTAAYYSKNR